MSGIAAHEPIMSAHPEILRAQLLGGRLCRCVCRYDQRASNIRRLSYCNVLLRGTSLATTTGPCPAQQMGKGGQSPAEIFKELGIMGVWGGLGTRVIMIGTLTGEEVRRQKRSFAFQAGRVVLWTGYVAVGGACVVEASTPGVVAGVIPTEYATPGEASLLRASD